MLRRLAWDLLGLVRCASRTTVSGCRRPQVQKLLPSTNQLSLTLVSPLVRSSITPSRSRAETCPQIGAVTSAVQPWIQEISRLQFKSRSLHTAPQQVRLTAWDLFLSPCRFSEVCWPCALGGNALWCLFFP